MINIIFLEEPVKYSNQTEFVLYLSDINSEQVLFNKLNEGFCFPNYFGFNWNAVYDCLRDFYWIDTKGIVLVHNDIPMINNESLKTYLQLLIDTIEDWKEDDEHYFKVIFPENSKLFIESILA